MWIYLRHYLNLLILLSEFNEFKTVGPYVLDWATEQYKCPLSHYISTALLASLQGLNLFWLYYILRIAYRFVWAGVELDDDRSDNDEDAFVEEEQSRRGLAVPGVTLNGELMEASGIAVGGERDGLTNRVQGRKV